jgi:hypothetical protein
MIGQHLQQSKNVILRQRVPRKFMTIRDSKIAGTVVKQGVCKFVVLFQQSIELLRCLFRTAAAGSMEPNGRTCSTAVGRVQPFASIGATTSGGHIFDKVDEFFLTFDDTVVNDFFEWVGF